MLNLNELNGVESSPISSSILENSIGNLQQKDSMAFSNYEFMVDLLKGAGFKAPSVIFSSGDGTVYPKTASYQNNFYSANIFGRDGYLNSWQASYRTDESYELTYFDGSTLFRGFRVDPSTGRVKTRALETRNGNPGNGLGLIQYIMGYNGSASIDDVGYYRHNFRTRHSESDNAFNALDVYLWDKNSDGREDIGSRRVVSMYGNGSFEVVEGSIVLGELDVDISTTAAKTIEQNTLAIADKGVIYFNKSKGKFRYSENGGPFKYLGSGSGSGGYFLESCNLNKCQSVSVPAQSGSPLTSDSINHAYVVRFHSHVKARIKRIYIPSYYGSMQVAVYANNQDSDISETEFKYGEWLLAYCKVYGGNNHSSMPNYYEGSVEVESPNWEFYQYYDNTPNLNTEPIVSGNFSIAISRAQTGGERASFLAGELNPFAIGSGVEEYDNLTRSEVGCGMNFDIVTYSSVDDEGHGGTYTLHSDVSDRIRKSLFMGDTNVMNPERINFIPYIKVVLEEIED